MHIQIKEGFFADMRSAQRDGVYIRIIDWSVMDVVSQSIMEAGRSSLIRRLSI